MGGASPEKRGTLRSETGPCSRGPSHAPGVRGRGCVRGGPGVVVGRGPRPKCASGAAPAEGPDRSRRVSRPCAPTSSRPSRSMAAPTRRVRSALPRIVARRFVEGPEVVVTPPARSPIASSGSRSGRGLATRRWRAWWARRYGTLTEFAERCSALSEVDRTATPAFTPPRTSPTKRRRKVFVSRSRPGRSTPPSQREQTPCCFHSAHVVTVRAR